MSHTTLIVGLGNPGEEYDATRHNVGREIVKRFGEYAEFPAFSFQKKWNAEVAEGKIGKEKIILLLPNTSMNKSGSAVSLAARFFKATGAHIFVVHDDADIELGRAKLSFGKHSAGHKGVESVIRGLKTREFWRFRIGIAGKRNIPAEKIVLKKFTPDETRLVKKVFKKTVEALKESADKGPESAMNTYNQN